MNDMTLRSFWTRKLPSAPWSPYAAMSPLLVFRWITKIATHMPNQVAMKLNHVAVTKFLWVRGSRWMSLHISFSCA